MRRQYLCDCAPGDMIEDVYVISGKQFAPTSTGKHYIKAFVSDTGPTDEIWRLANACPKLKAVFLEGCFPNEMRWLADVSKHLTPNMVADELKKLTRPARILIVHIKARFQQQILDELKALNNPAVEIAQFAVPYTF